MLFIAPVLLILIEGVWQIIINYPPSLQQLNLGIGNLFSLWTVKVISLMLLTFAIYLFSVNLKSGIKKLYWVLVLSVPTLSLIWMAYPVDALKVFIVSLVFYFASKKKLKIIYGIALGIFAILILNILIFKEKPEIIKIISLNQPRQEVNFHYQIENNLNPRITVPAILKRLVYNKIFFAFRDGVNLSLTFFDIETLFFQEIHPLGQKSFVMFFWPEIVVFIIGIWFYQTKQIKPDPKDLLLIAFSFTYFILSDASIERRLLITIFSIATVLAKTIWIALHTRSKTLKLVIIPLLVLTFYGWMTNGLDRYVRPEFWLDNRPIAYNFILSNLKSINTNYKQIVVPNTLHALPDYCRYYLNMCPEFTFNDFDLQKQPILKNTLYIGFIGNFVGKNNDNAFPVDKDKEIVDRGLKILYKTNIPNNIANGYGQTLLIVQSD